MTQDLPPEFDLIDALLAGDRAAARKLADALHQRGIDYATIGEALKEYPHLEEPLWELLNEVSPLARRAARRRAIRAAEQRDWGDWQAGKRKK